MIVDILLRDDAHAPFEEGMRLFALRVLSAMGANEDAELSLLLTADDEIQELNRDHRGLDKPTDVLSFPLQEGEGAGMLPLLGDVVISVPYAKRQATGRGWPLEAEIEFLLIHGILHLLGWDHQDSAEATAMETETARVWHVLGQARSLPIGFLSGG